MTNFDLSAFFGQFREETEENVRSLTSGLLALDYQLEGFRVQVRTLDLSAPWPHIRQALLELVAD